MIKRLSPLVASAALAACASTADRDTRGWFYNAEGGEAKLAYGTPQSDDVVLSLTCAPGSGRVTLSQGRLRRDARIELSAGGAADAFIGRNHIDELWGGYRVDAEAPSGAPVLQRFRRGAVLSVRAGRTRTPLPATRGDRARIE